MWINNECFKLKPSDFPGMPPELSEESRTWWKEQRRRCIEGYWSGGRWMPPGLYFYINFWNILINVDKWGKVKRRAQPELWDIHWEMSYGLMEAYGLAGFDGQKEIMDFKEYASAETSLSALRKKTASMPQAKDFLWETTKDLGKPQFLFEAKNFPIMGNRGCGKSYFIAGAVIGHDWLFDGLTEYKPSNDVKEAMEIVVGAGDAKYSTDLLSKVKFGLDYLPGAITIGEQKFRSPFSKLYNGVFALNSDTQAYYKKNIGGNWETFGTGSVIKHKSYKDNSFAAAGSRPARLILEEYGLFDNGLESLHNGEDCMKNGEYKFGTAIPLGTGGDMDRGTIAASRLFRNPSDYKCVEYEDLLEHKGKIGYFISTVKGTSQYKDKNGVTNYALGEKEDDAIREDIRKGRNASVALDARKQNQPRTVSEMFLSKHGNIFPRAELQEHLATIEGNSKYISAEDVGELIYEDDGNLKWKHLPSDRAVRIFPHDITKDDCRGAIQIWHHPLRDDSGKVPNYLYIAGIDPYDHDASGTTSLGSTIIYLKIYQGLQIQEIPVAEYTGRHERGSDAYYEQVRRLLTYYNARALFENNLIGLYKYFERKDCTFLLMDIPEYAKEVTGSQPNRKKGLHFGTAQIIHGELLVKNWLEEEMSPGVLQLTKLRSVALIKELIAYDREGNFDRVRALMATMYAREETFRYSADAIAKVKTLSEDPFWTRNYSTDKKGLQSRKNQSYTGQNFNQEAVQI